MAVETFLALPRWVYLGVAVGALMSVGVAVTFLVAAKLFPDGNRDRSTDESTETRRRAEIRRYLGAIDERYTEDGTVAGETVAFYLPTRDVAVTFDARTFLALEETQTYTILMEHEMPGIALGHRLPFQTPAVPFDEADSDTRGRGRPRTNSELGRQRQADAAVSAYEVLGLPTGASEDAVRKAYRERIKEVHPDHGGDEAEFQRVREAYDAARRHAR